MGFIEIDGSAGEGGGQIVRTAAGLSASTGKPIHISNIRAGRPKPGLSYQHLCAVKAAQMMTDAETKGLDLESKELSFIPGEIKSGRYEINIGTAGSVSLVLQTALMPAILCKGDVQIKVAGGTDVPMSPPIDYIKNVFLRLLSKMGVDIRMDVLRRGHYPRGGGIVRADVTHPSDIGGIELCDRGRLIGIRGVSHCTSLPGHVAERQKKAALDILSKELAGVDVHIASEVSAGYGAGSGVVLAAEYENTVLGASSLGYRGKRAEKVGFEAATRLIEEVRSPGTVDSHMGDQLIPYLALAKGPSSYVCRSTSHLKTNIYTVEKMLDARFKLSSLSGGYVNIKTLI